MQKLMPANFNAQPYTITDTINQEQLYAAESVTEAVYEACLLSNAGLAVNRERLFYIDGGAGTGKIYLYNCNISILRQNNGSVSALAWTGLGAVLQYGSRTI